jgi:hypothetical protein
MPFVPYHDADVRPGQRFSYVSLAPEIVVFESDNSSSSFLSGSHRFLLHHIGYGMSLIPEVFSTRDNSRKRLAVHPADCCRRTRPKV